jgi:hypothetical protein
VTVPAADKLRRWPKTVPERHLDEESAADLLDAIDALPVWPASIPEEHSHDPYIYNEGYAEAMRQVKALLHPEDGGQ